MPSPDLEFGERPANVAARRFFARGVRQLSQFMPRVSGRGGDGVEAKPVAQHHNPLPKVGT